MKDLIDKTRRLSSRFPSQYDKRSRLIDLVEEMGELAQAVHITEGFKQTGDPAKRRTVEDVADAICDMMYELILLADDYGLDVEKEYLDMLERLEKRVDSGEFG